MCRLENPKLFSRKKKRDKRTTEDLSQVDNGPISISLIDGDLCEYLIKVNISNDSSHISPFSLSKTKLCYATYIYVYLKKYVCMHICYIAYLSIICYLL